MRQNWYCFFMAVIFALLTAYNVYLISEHRSEMEMLALHAKTFLEQHRTVSTNHSEAYQIARDLHQMASQPSRSLVLITAAVGTAMFLCMLNLRRKRTSIDQ